ncbi:hypothetical protein KEM55_008574 [Ascosphaera atra]|nr:hypothetical protein KEM55_008574 [Ascosphaera atra]
MRQEALDRIPPEDEASRDVGSTVAATAATANNKDAHAHTTTGSDAKPPNPLILTRYMSDETKHPTHDSSSNHTRGVSGHGGGMAGSLSKPERQRTTSLAGALLRKGALANTGNGTGKKGSKNDSPSSGNANAANATTLAAQLSQPSRSPRGPSPTLHSAKRSSPQLGSHNNLGRSTSAMELVSPSPQLSHSYASSHRSRSAMALRDAAYLGPSTHGLAPSPSSQYINAYSTGYPSPALSYSLRQQHHKVHRTASTPTVGSSYKRRGDKRYSSASATTNPTTRSEQVRDLKDQVTDLQIKISQLKVKAQADSIRRRKSMQQMKENGDPAGQPSLFTDSRQGSAAGNTYYNNKYKSLGPLDLERAARTKALRSSKDRERVSRGDVRAAGKGQPTDTTSSSVYTKWKSTSSATAGNTPKHASVERLR